MAGTIKQFPATLEDRIEEIKQARAQLLAELEGCASDAALAKLAPDRWSIAEVLHHLYLAEKGIAGMLRKALSSNERHNRASDQELRAEWQRIGSVVGNREERASAPPSAVSENAPGLAEVIGLLNQSRQRLLDTIGSTDLDELSSVSMSHPFIGPLTGAGWISLIAYHELRHVEQIREIKSSL